MDWPGFNHSLTSLHSHESKSTTGHGNMAGQTGLGKRKERHTKKPFKKRVASWQTVNF